VLAYVIGLRHAFDKPVTIVIKPVILLEFRRSLSPSAKPRPCQKTTIER